MSRSDSRRGKAEGQGRASAKKSSPDAGAGKRGRGRPSGKRSDPNFVQTTAYVRAETYRDVRIELLKEGVGREYSELVEELLSQWMKSRK